MLMYKRYQALRAIHIHVPGEPGNEANTTPDNVEKSFILTSLS